MRDDVVDYGGGLLPSSSVAMATERVLPQEYAAGVLPAGVIHSRPCSWSPCIRDSQARVLCASASLDKLRASRLRAGTQAIDWHQARTWTLTTRTKMSPWDVVS